MQVCCNLCGRTTFGNITGQQEGYSIKTAKKHHTHTHTHLVIIQQSTVLVYIVYSTIIYKYFCTNSKKDRVQTTEYGAVSDVH